MGEALINGYQGMKAIVTGGGGSGMGAAAVRLLLDAGAEVHVLDVQATDAPVASSQQVDLKDPVAITDAVAQIGDGVQALFNCVGVAGNRTSDLDTFLINFAGVRHLTDAVVPLMSTGGAIATIASNAGEGWRADAEAYAELVARTSFEEAIAWFGEHPELLEPIAPTSAYRVSKRAVAAWSVLTAAERGQNGERAIRQNAVMPGFTQTPMGAQFKDILSGSYFESYPLPLGRYLNPDEPAKAMLFLNSPAASGVNGVTLTVDGGAAAALEAGAR